MNSHEIDYRIFGDDMQAVEIELDHMEAVRAEVGAMLFMEEGIEMQTGTQGGIFSGLKRVLTGENFFITSFINSGTGKKACDFCRTLCGQNHSAAAEISWRKLSLSEGCIFMLCRRHRYQYRIHKENRSRVVRRRRIYIAASFGRRPCIHTCRRNNYQTRS